MKRRLALVTLVLLVHLAGVSGQILCHSLHRQRPSEGSLSSSSPVFGFKCERGCNAPSDSTSTRSTGREYWATFDYDGTSPTGTRRREGTPRDRYVLVRFGNSENEVESQGQQEHYLEELKKEAIDKALLKWKPVKKRQPESVNLRPGDYLRELILDHFINLDLAGDEDKALNVVGICWEAGQSNNKPSDSFTKRLHSSVLLLREAFTYLRFFHVEEPKGFQRSFIVYNHTPLFHSHYGKVAEATFYAQEDADAPLYHLSKLEINQHYRTRVITRCVLYTMVDRLQRKREKTSKGAVIQGVELEFKRPQPFKKWRPSSTEKDVVKDADYTPVIDAIFYLPTNGNVAPHRSILFELNYVVKSIKALTTEEREALKRFPHHYGGGIASGWAPLGELLDGAERELRRINLLASSSDQFLKRALTGIALLTPGSNSTSAVVAGGIVGWLTEIGASEVSAPSAAVKTVLLFSSDNERLKQLGAEIASMGFRLEPSVAMSDAHRTRHGLQQLNQGLLAHIHTCMSEGTQKGWATMVVKRVNSLMNGAPEKPSAKSYAWYKALMTKMPDGIRESDEELLSAVFGFVLVRLKDEVVAYATYTRRREIESGRATVTYSLDSFDTKADFNGEKENELIFAHILAHIYADASYAGWDEEIWGVNLTDGSSRLAEYIRSPVVQNEALEPLDKKKMATHAHWRLFYVKTVEQLVGDQDLLVMVPKDVQTTLGLSGATGAKTKGIVLFLYDGRYVGHVFSNETKQGGKRRLQVKLAEGHRSVPALRAALAHFQKSIPREKGVEVQVADVPKLEYVDEEKGRTMKRVREALLAN